MEGANLHPVVIDTFAHYYKKIISGATGLISDKDIRPITSDEIEDADVDARYDDSHDHDPSGGHQFLARRPGDLAHLDTHFAKECAHATVRLRADRSLGCRGGLGSRHA